jgi:hypothetical protein
MIGTYRDAEADMTSALAKTLENLIRGRDATQIGLKGLTLEEVGQMLKGLSHKELPPAVVNEIYAETQGNPFFVEELARYLREENRLYDEAGEFNSAIKISEFEVPQSVRLLVGRRLARTGEPAQKMLATAAVIGRSFSFEVLEASTQSNGLLESVEEVEKAGLICSDAESLETRFEFSHELIRQTVLRGLSAPRRRRLHLEVAGAIERIYNGRLEDHIGELAYHYSAGGNAPKAVEYLIQSGRQAAERFALLEAIGSVTRALELLQKLPDDEHRVREELKIQGLLMQSWWSLRGQNSPEAVSAVERTLELSERLGDNRELFWGLNSMMSTYLNQDARKARGFAERELAVARQVGDPGMVAHAEAAAMGHVLVLQGEFVMAREYIERGLQFFLSRLRPGVRQPWAAWAQSPGLSLLAWDLWFLGYPSQALDRLARALAATEGESDPFWRSSGWFYALRVYMCLHHPQTLDIASSLMAYVSDRGLHLADGMAPLFVAWALAEQGRTVEAVSELDRNRKEPRSRDPIPSWLYLMFAEIFGKAGNIAAGLGSLARGLRCCDEAGESSHKAELHRLNGELILMRDQASVADAERCFHTALEVAREQSAKSWELRATMSLARSLAKRGQQTEARSMLEDVYGWFTEGFDTADLKEAKALLQELAG